MTTIILLSTISLTLAVIAWRVISGEESFNAFWSRFNAARKVGANRFIKVLPKLILWTVIIVTPVIVAGFYINGLLEQERFQERVARERAQEARERVTYVAYAEQLGVPASHQDIFITCMKNYRSSLNAIGLPNTNASDCLERNDVPVNKTLWTSKFIKELMETNAKQSN